MTRIGGIILCGGKSTRMGTDKAALPVAGETMLSRTVRIMSQVVSPIVVVAAEGQRLPAVDGGIEVVRDRQPGQGPLEGLAAGLAALGTRADAAYASSVDVPLLRAEFIAAIIERLEPRYAIVVPREERFYHPLAAAYRTSVLGEVESLLAAGQRRPAFLLDRVATLEVDVEQLRAVDPELDSLRNCNRPEDYQEALRRLR